jgi:predicted RecB family nuclease
MRRERGMKREGDGVRLSATDVATFAACPHASALDAAALAGDLSRPFWVDPSAALLAERGLEHERRTLATLAARAAYEAIATEGSPSDAVAKTLDAMRRGVPIVYQGAIAVDRWFGRPDFLVRVDAASALGPFSYEVLDTKLARSAKPGALLQICFYSELLARVQERFPERMRLVLGDGREVTFETARYGAYFRHVRASLEQALASSGATYPEPVEHCDDCDWRPACDARWRQDDHLSLVAGITTHQRRALEDRGVRTVRRLATWPLDKESRVAGIAPPALARAREQARVQVEGRDAGALIYERIAEYEEKRGLALLPPPSVGDLFVDIEGDPYALGDGLEYLIGVSEHPSRPEHTAFWSFDRHQERAAFESFMRMVIERRRRHPSMHVYHYAPYEPTAFKKLAGRYASFVDELDELLRGEVFVDLYRAVRQGIRASVESYSIKRIEPLYGFTRAVTLRDARACLEAFETWLELEGSKAPRDDLLSSIEAYNKDDCLSALHLRDWLEARRRDAEIALGRPLPRPRIASGEASESLAEHVDRVRAVMGDLLVGIPEDEAARSEGEHARWLVAHLLEWHRREEKSAHWEYFRLCDLSDDDLAEEKAPISGLTYLGPDGVVHRSIVHRYRFPPQEHAIDRALEIHDPRTRARAGELVAIDDAAGLLSLKRGKSSIVPHPTAVIPKDIVTTKELRESLLRFGEHVRDAGGARVSEVSASAPYAASVALLGRSSRIDASAGARGERIEERAIDAALAIDGAILPVQGPPGTGKTYLGARMIVALARAGKRVGITANSHKVITNLLDEACRAADAAGVSLRAVQRGRGLEDETSRHSGVAIANDNADVVAALTSGRANVAAGTAWLWSRAEMMSRVDLLFVDEAGQMSLANVLAASPSARGLVLLGDPQQLDQPQKGVHPPGTAVSALGHVLRGAPTLRADQGLFLEETWRMHPDVCGFISEAFYDGRLRARADLATLRLDAPAPWGGTGLRFVPVSHRGCQSASREEARVVAQIVRGLIGDERDHGERCEPSTWTDRLGRRHRLTLDDILIVAPYNAHVALLREAIAGARVGTVDKFQGQEAPVVIYSMATSSADDAPRGAEFLYSPNRLNVGLSRARCASFLVASPRLFDRRCQTVRQMELVSAFCRYVEVSREVRVDCT